MLHRNDMHANWRPAVAAADHLPDRLLRFLLLMILRHSSMSLLMPQNSSLVKDFSTILSTRQYHENHRK